MSLRQLICGFGMNQLAVAGIYLSFVSVVSLVEMELQNPGRMTDDPHLQLDATLVFYIYSLPVACLGGIIHSTALLAIPPGVSSRRRRIVALVLAPLVPLIDIVPGWAVLFNVYPISIISGTLVYGLCCTTHVGRSPAKGTTESVSAPVAVGDVPKSRSAVVRVVTAVVGVSLVLIGFAVERRASLCGVGYLPVHLPYDLTVDWSFGIFRLTSAEGLRVIGPLVEPEGEGEGDLFVRWVSRYTVEHGFIAEVVLESGELAYFALERQVGSAIEEQRLRPGELRQRAGTDIESIPWVDVRPLSCFFGQFWPARALVLVGLAVALIFAIRPTRPA